MQLTRVERWILSNQYRILEALHPKEAEWLADARKAIEEGFEFEYDRLAQEVYPDRDCLSSEECQEVLEIMAMFRALKDGYEALEDKSGIEESGITFEGFDGNNETAQMAYAQYFCGRSGAYIELERGDNFNSHCPVLDMYRRMLSEWNMCEHRNDLSKEDIIRIATAQIHPENR